MKKIVITIVVSVLYHPIFCQSDNSAVCSLNQELENVYLQGYIHGFSVAIVDQYDLFFTEGFEYSDDQKKVDFKPLNMSDIG